jgi:hypothetical protein
MAVRESYLDELNDVISNSPSGQRYPFTCTASNGEFPYFVALGNHDVDGILDTTPESQYNYWSNYVGPRLPSTLVGIKNFRWGPNNPHDYRTAYSFDYKNAHFIIVNQYHSDPNYPTADPLACISPELYDWIDQDLFLTDRPIKFAFGHEGAWPFCSILPDCGGEDCPVGHPDNQNPPYRPRPYSSTGDWTEPYGRHWWSSLADGRCEPGSRDAFWNMLASHNVVAHFVGHSHAYSARLVKGDGTRRNDIGAYSKRGAVFESSEGVWEIDNGQGHDSAGAVYILTTIKDNVVTFEAYDQIGTSETFQLVETWSVHVGTKPYVGIIAPADGATYVQPGNIAILAEALASEQGATVREVKFYANGTMIGVATSSPYGISWNNVPSGVYQLTAVAVDSLGKMGTSDPVVVRVYAPSSNHLPVLTHIDDKVINEDNLLRFTAIASDPDPGNGLTFTLINAPYGATIEAATGVFSWLPNETQGPGLYLMTLRVTDNGSPALSADQMFGITVNETNQAPVLTPIDGKGVEVGHAVTFRALAMDADLPPNKLIFDLVGAPSGASIDPNSGVFQWTPSRSQIGDHSFIVRVTDDGVPALYDSKYVSITVREPVEIPTQGLVGYWSFNEGSGRTAMDASGYGNNGAITGATWVAGQIGGALSFDGSDDTVIVSNVPVNTLTGGQNTTSFWMYWNGPKACMPFGWNGSYDLYLSTDGFGINTGQGNILGIPSTGLSGRWVHVAAIFYNGVPSASNSKLYIDGVEQSISDRLKATTRSVTATTKVTISGWGKDTGYKFRGMLDEVRIYNRALSASEIAALARVEQPNQRPIVDAGQAQEIVFPQNTVNLNGTVTDPEDSLLTTWSKVSGPGVVVFGNENAVDTTAIFYWAGVYVLRLTADDGFNNPVSDDVTITVYEEPPNSPPTVDAGSDDSITLPDDTVTLNGTVVDPDDTPITTWTKVSGPGLVAFGNAGAIDTTATFSGAGTYVLRLTADDGVNNPVSDDVTITVHEEQVFPTEGLVGYWNFNDGSGTVAEDASGYANNGAITGATWVAGQVGGALSFDGSDDTVIVNNVPVNTLVGGQNTVSFWMNWNGPKSCMPFGWNGTYDLFLSPDGFGINTGQGNILGISSAGLSGRWVHVAVIFYNGIPSPSNSKIYIDGIEQSISDRLKATTRSVSATAKVFISGWGKDTGYKFRGMLDEVRIYNRALSTGEIAALAQ